MKPSLFKIRSLCGRSHLVICILLVWIVGGRVLPVACGQQGYPASGQPAVAPVTVVDRTAEFNVKAVYLYNFARYIEWPEHAGMPNDAFHIGILGESGVVVPLEKLARFKKVADKRTGTQRNINLSRFRAVSECRPCHILFVAEAIDAEQIAEVLQRFESAPVLIVGETGNFAAAGGDAEFLLVNGGVRFDLNLYQTNRKRLKLDAKLLKAANQIVDETAATSVSQN